jgi:Protein of unknown function (DUF2523)
MDFLLNFFNSTIDFFNFIINYFNNYIYYLVTQIYAQYIIYATIASIKAKIETITFAWDIAKQILDALSISEILAAIWEDIDSTTMSFIAFFRIPEAINNILNALVARFVIDFMKW